MDQLKIQPKKGEVIIDITQEDKKTQNGLYVPNFAQEKEFTGTVVCVHPDDENGIQEGNRLLYVKYCGSQFHHEGRELLLLNPSEILAILN